MIRGTALNQDGRSNGLTAPSGRAQQAVIRAALADAGVDAAEIGLVEAHGTGTPLGDPIELAALQAVYGEGEVPCRVVSTKTRIGHLEAAAGVAGLIQAVGAVYDGVVAPHLHLDTLNPRIRLEGSRLERIGNSRHFASLSAPAESWQEPLAGAMRSPPAPSQPLAGAL